MAEPVADVAAAAVADVHYSDCVAAPFLTIRVAFPTARPQSYNYNSTFYQTSLNALTSHQPLTLYHDPYYHGHDPFLYHGHADPCHPFYPEI